MMRLKLKSNKLKTKNTNKGIAMKRILNDLSEIAILFGHATTLMLQVTFVITVLLAPIFIAMKVASKYNSMPAGILIILASYSILYLGFKSSGALDQE
jgi:hypothetical protein